MQGFAGALGELLDHWLRWFAGLRAGRASKVRAASSASGAQSPFRPGVTSLFFHRGFRWEPPQVKKETSATGSREMAQTESQRAVRRRGMGRKISPKVPLAAAMGVHGFGLQLKEDHPRQPIGRPPASGLAKTEAFWVTG